MQPHSVAYDAQQNRELSFKSKKQNQKRKVTTQKKQQKATGHGKINKAFWKEKKTSK